MRVNKGWRAWVVLCGWGWSLALHAGQIYRCQAYGGGHFWSPSHCQQYRALVERVQTVPDGLPFDRQVKVAEQALGLGKAPTVSTAPTKTEQQAAQRRLQAEQRQRVRCQRWQTELERQRALARQPLKARRQEAVARQQAALQQQLNACAPGF